MTSATSRTLLQMTAELCATTARDGEQDALR